MSFCYHKCVSVPDNALSKPWTFCMNTSCTQPQTFWPLIVVWERVDVHFPLEPSYSITVQPCFLRVNMRTWHKAPDLEEIGASPLVPQSLVIQVNWWSSASVWFWPPMMERRGDSWIFIVVTNSVPFQGLSVKWKGI